MPAERVERVPRQHERQAGEHLVHDLDGLLRRHLLLAALAVPRGAERPQVDLLEGVPRGAEVAVVLDPADRQVVGDLEALPVRRAHFHMPSTRLRR
jgi:hypothetical protein